MKLWPVVLMAAMPAAPQPAPAPAAAAGPQPIKLGSVLVQGSIRTRLEAWSWFEADSGDPSYPFVGNIARLSFSRSADTLDWQIELAAPFLLGLPDRAVAAGTQGQLGLGANYYLANDRSRNAVGVFPKQAWLRFKHQRHAVRIGRFEYMDGSEMTPKNATLAAIKRDRVNMRLLGHFGWAHVGRSFDGAHYTYNLPRGNVTILGAIPTRGVFQTDGWGQTHTAFGYGAYSHAWGGGTHSADTRVFGLHYRDWRDVLKTDNRALAARRADMDNVSVNTFGGHSVHAFETAGGTMDVLLWGAAQTGQWGAITHRAHAVNVEAGIQPKQVRRLKPWIRGGFHDGSGDSDPSDSRHGTFFQVLPTPRPFARFPFFNMMNNRDVFGILVLRPHAQWTVSAEVHAMRLSNRNDLWYQGGGVFQPWSFGYVGRASGGARSLANLYDASVEYRYRPNLTFSGYFGVADGRSAIKTIYPRGHRGEFGYVEFSRRF